MIDWKRVGILREELGEADFASVIELFLDEESQHLAGLSDFIGKPISLQAESSIGPDQYDIVLL